MNAKSHPALELKGLGVSFGQRVVLDGITLSLLPDGIDVLMGPVKSGKSTLLRTLAGLYEGHPVHKSWGAISVLGVPLNQDNRPLLVQQHARALDQALLQALLLPLRATVQRSPSEWQRLGLDYLAQYGLSEFLPQAETPLLQCNIRAQRSVQILAQVLLQPALLMIDEPTYGLNDSDAAWLVDWLKTLRAHCKLWVALHNQMQARRLADNIMLIGGGRLLAYQNTTQFFQHPANAWVEQFIRTGGLSLPAPDAQVQDLAEGVTPPPPLSEGAQQAIRSFSTAAPVIQPVAYQLNTPPSVQSSVPVAPPTPAFNAPSATRKPVELPMPSRDGVELAAGVGEVIYREASAPRGFNWIVPGKLAGCPAPGVSAPIDYDLSLLAKVGITRLITLTETDLDQEALRRHHLTNTHLPIFDREAPSIGQTHMLLMRMQKHIEAGEVLAVHCKAGLGRTGTILAAWMIREGGLTAQDSMLRLRRIEPGFIQSKDQEDFLRRYEEDLTNRLV